MIPGASPDSEAAEYITEILAPDLDVVFVGAAPSLHSARAGHWYAGPRNRFYLLLHQAGFTPRLFRPDEDVDLPQLGIGLAGIFRHIISTANNLLPAPSEERREGLRQRLLACAPRFVCYNGKDVYQMATGRVCTDWGEQTECLGCSRVFVAHSSSGRADAWGLDRLALYRELRGLVGSR